MIENLKEIIRELGNKSIFNPDCNSLSNQEWNEIIELFSYDYQRYYSDSLDIYKVKYFPGLLATFFYRIARKLFLKGDEINALEFSSVGFSLTAIEIYFSAEIGKGLKINHGIGTVIGSRTILGDNVLLHHAVTIGEKNGGRAKIGNNVIIYPGSIIVGDIYIGENSIIGANVFVDKSYPEKSKIY
ncbi:serine O-acetyltransferase [Flavobacterium sp. LC2016-01]|uniref:serine O-acetyltransferase n=1 Tax=Flavobacterium sp. LC2016-01 TaxID=2675876 RepID=UPI0012BAA8CA|nr:serine O-acetyltransferase [Flavobacterium sp. LC2016-01]MTH17530.1 serine O-acetyltransferase [Flavobacterium sp. LC2016-01]